MFFSFFAALLGDLGDKEEALKYIEISQQLLHNAGLDEYLKN